MERILLIEDDLPLSLGIEFSLKDEGFDVRTADSIAQGYSQFRQGNFDLILLDVMLPDGSGYELCKRLRTESEIPVIFLTACDEEVHIVMGLDIGGDDYITKPFKIRELVSRIRAALRRAPRESNLPPVVLHTGDLKIYPLETRIVKEAEEIALTPAEYRLLTIFVQNPLLTLTREWILEKLWDVDGDFVNDNTLTVLIRRLREKLGDNPARPEYVQTVRGTGYKWGQRCVK